MEICFVPDNDYGRFLREARLVERHRGDIVDVSGRKLGEHDGVEFYTVGQRRGIGVAVGKPLYVISLDPASRRVVVGEDEELLTQEVLLEDVVWSGPGKTNDARDTGRSRVTAKVRYNMEPRKATLMGGDRPRLVFDEPVRAVTTGQIAVAYRGQSVVAGGKITSTP